MRTKTLVFSAIALAGGLLSASAQSNVYSQNVVGYVNVPVAAATQVLLANPLDNGTNDLNSLLSGAPNKSSASIWNGTGFTPSTKLASGWNPDLVVPVGTGFFIKTVGTATITNTFVGNVVAAPGGSVTNSIPANQQIMVGSMIPYADDLNGTNILLSVLANKSSLSTWNGSGYTPSTKLASGWNPDQNISVAQGFFIKSVSATNWVQTLPAQ